jgi:hypothetical protein
LGAAAEVVVEPEVGAGAIPSDEVLGWAQAVTATVRIASESERKRAVTVDREGQRPARDTDTMIDSL